mgnify:CR=1 FL=1
MQAPARGSPRHALSLSRRRQNGAQKMGPLALETPQCDTNFVPGKWVTLGGPTLEKGCRNLGGEGVPKLGRQAFVRRVAVDRQLPILKVARVNLHLALNLFIHAVLGLAIWPVGSPGLQGMGSSRNVFHLRQHAAVLGAIPLHVLWCSTQSCSWNSCRKLVIAVCARFHPTSLPSAKRSRTLAGISSILRRMSVTNVDIASVFAVTLVQKKARSMMSSSLNCNPNKIAVLSKWLVPGIGSFSWRWLSGSCFFHR